MYWGRSLMFQKTIDPRVSETDGAGHFNNTIIPVWFESYLSCLPRVCHLKNGNALLLK
ncbi:hypothetical protein SAMN05216352_101319 [Alteribacillus bidgolensis]|uniref:Acyl-CoA thioester hydrolase n=1 Tax=Alteribacillus bidgolensis TaxID=930129 RepID=A0A1G8CH33_9BACI|nr:hypothetical protein SAMN05216352_101319 [Alteribacillus bidgolensis]